MIGGMVTHTGSQALARHLLRTDENESVAIRIFGLCATDLVSALKELQLMGSDARTQKPLVHAWSSPAIHYDDDQWQHYWDRFEREFDLLGQPFAEAQHTKIGKDGRIVAHRHRVYMRITPAGRVIPMRHTAPRMEKLSRIAEFMNGEPFVSGVYNKSVIGRLSQEGYGTIADAMIAQGLGSHRAGSVCSSDERATSDRTDDISADEVKRRIFIVLSSKTSGADLVAALAEVGLRLAQGEKAVVAVTPRGNAIPLLRGYNQIARQRGGPSMKKAELTARLAGAELPRLADVVVEAPHNQNDWITHVGAERRDKREVVSASHDSEARDSGHVPVLEIAPVEQRDLVYDMPGKAANVQVPDDKLTLSPDAEPINPLTMTPAQQKALDKWIDAMFAPTSVEVQAPQTPQEAVLPAENQRSELENERSGRNRLAVENRHYGQPGLEHPTWRDNYKAKLAGIPPDFGSRIAWIDTLERDRKRIQLRNSNAIITTEPGRISTSADHLETTSIIAELARTNGWAEAVINGGSREWREALAREATRAGITIVNPDLYQIVIDEKQRMETDAVLAAWQNARALLKQSRSQADAMGLVSVLESLPPGILDHVEDQQIRGKLAADIKVLDRYRNNLGQGSSTASTIEPNGTGEENSSQRAPPSAW